MLATQFFRFFWLTYIALLGLLGLSLAMLAGELWATGRIAAALAATLMGVACALLCGLADETRRSLPSD